MRGTIPTILATLAIGMLLLWAAWLLLWATVPIR